MSAVRKRKLSPDEIERLVNALDIVPQIIPLSEVKLAVIGTQKSVLKAQLSAITVVQDHVEDIINDLTEYILKHYLTSQIVPGDTVGFRAAEALAQPATQIALNAFHFSGSNLNVTSGIGGIKEILETKSSESQKHRMCTVHFKDKRLKLSDIIFHKQSQFVASKVYDYVNDHNILQYQDFFDGITEPDWLTNFREIMTDWPVPGISATGTPVAEWILELEMDTDRMYAMNVTMEDLAKVIKHLDGYDQIFVWFSPMSAKSPRMYVAADTVKVMNNMGSKFGRLGDYLQLVYFNLELVPAWKSYTFKGILNISNIHPVEQSVLGVITGEIKLSDNLWWIQLSRLQLRVTGVTREMLVELITHTDTGMTVDKLPDTIDPQLNLIVRTPVTDTRKPSEILIDIRDEIEKSAKQLIREGRPVDSFALLTNNELYNLFNYYYIETEGSNLHGILIRKDVDDRYTISSDIHEITETLGTEAVRNYITFVLYRMIKNNGMDIDPRHLMLIGDVMVSTGKLIGFTMSGAAKLVPDHLTKTTIGEATKHLIQASVFGESDPLSSVTSSLYIGKEPQLGTGMVKIKADEQLSRKLSAEIEEGRTASLAVDDFASALDQLTADQGEPLISGRGKSLRVSNMPVGTTRALPAPGTLTPSASRFFDLSLEPGSVQPNLLRDAVRAVRLPDPSVCEISERRQRGIYPIKGLTTDVLKFSTSGIPEPGLNLLPPDTIYNVRRPAMEPLISDIYAALSTTSSTRVVIGPPPEPLSVLATTPIIATTNRDIMANIGLDSDLSETWDI